MVRTRSQLTKNRLFFISYHSLGQHTDLSEISPQRDGRCENVGSTAWPHEKPESGGNDRSHIDVLYIHVAHYYKYG